MEKKPKIINHSTLLTSAMRKIWRNSAMRKRALELALVDDTVKAKERQYRCCSCGSNFLLQQIEVNHKIMANQAETITEKFHRLMCKVAIVKGDKIGTFAGETLDLDEVVEEYLEVMCIHCHKALTSKQNKNRKK